MREREKGGMGISAYAALGALTGGSYGALLAYGSQLGPGSQLPASIVIGAVVGALFGAAMRDTRRL